MYAIIDIESTGGAYNEEGITEIAIYKFNGVDIVERFVSLINPERPIQPYVSELTKITQPMLRLAPKFYEVAKQIVEITKDCIIVAHNAQNDYRMLKLEFKRLGFSYSRKTLCTVALSRELLPEAPSYSLGKLVRSLGIPISDRHRADGDARATLQLFRLLLTKDFNKKIVKQDIVNQDSIDQSYKFFHLIEDLPNAIGVFYLYNDKNEIIYLSRATNIKKKVLQIFTNQSSFNQRIQNETQMITFEETGHILIASLKEQTEIEIHQPKINKLKRKPYFSVALYENTLLPKGIEVGRKSSRRTPLLLLKSKRDVEFLLEKITTEPQEKPLETLQNIKKYLAEFSDVLVILKGRRVDEKSVILIEKNKIIGFCYFNLNHQILKREVLQQKMIKLSHSEEQIAILHHYLLYHSDYKIIPLYEK